MGTPQFSVPSLQKLIDDGHQIAAVFTQPDKPAGRGKHLQSPPVKTLALEHSIPVHQPQKIKNNEEVRSVFETIVPDACIVVAYGKILPEWMLAIPRLGCINVHASLLPKYRGAAPINWAIARGEELTGVTIMQMDVGMDTGPMLIQRSIEIGEDTTAPELAETLSHLGANLLSDALPLIEKGELTSEIQSNDQATYAPILKREDGLIDWSMTAAEIANRVRAFQPWPASYLSFRGARLTIWRARSVKDGAPVDSSISGGTVLSITEEGISVACGASTALLVQETQIEGKRRVLAREFANGARLKPGDKMAE
jgi:methionyl-tRNA formyltransferase